MFKFDTRPLTNYWGGEFKRTFRSGVVSGFNDAGEWLTRYSRNHHPTFRNRTNTLAKSLRWESRGVQGSVSSEVFYAPYLYYGTKRHFIAPKNALALSWTQGGTRFFSKGHWVSGIKRSEWIKQNYEDRNWIFDKHVTDGVMKAFGE